MLLTISLNLQGCTNETLSGQPSGEHKSLNNKTVVTHTNRTIVTYTVDSLTWQFTFQNDIAKLNIFNNKDVYMPSLFNADDKNVGIKFYDDEGHSVILFGTIKNHRVVFNEMYSIHIKNWVFNSHGKAVILWEDNYYYLNL